MLLAAAGVSACGGDSSTAPTPPPGTANKVPRVLGITSANGRSVPAIVYTSRDGRTDTRVDSASATLQDDSMLVVRTYETDLPHGSNTGSGIPWSFTGAGVVDASGVAVFHYTDGPPDTVHVLPNGGVVVALSIKDQNLSVPFATLSFTSPYHGAALNPIMRVRGFSPAQAPIGSDNLTLGITGSNFMPSMTVKWGNTSLHVTYVSPSQVTADVPAALLVTAATVPITLTNPGPGGGLRVYAYDVVAPVPAISALSPATMLQGSSAFTLQVTGSNFTPQSIVQWNGVVRPTTYVSPTQLNASILAGDVATVGAAKVTVQSPPPGGGTSNVAGFAVVTATDQPLAMVTAPFVAYRVVADPVHSLVYASARANGETHYPQSVAAFDPGTGQMLWSLGLGKDIAAIAVSDDGQYLYVSYSNDPTMTRVALATHTVDATFDVGSGTGGPFQPAMMAVVPGHPHSVAVLRAGYSSAIGPVVDLGIYDDGVPRTNRLTGSAVPSQFVFEPDGSIWGFTEPGVVEDIAVDANGVSVRNTVTRPMMMEFLEIIGTQVYGSLGALYDPAKGTRTSLPGFTATGALTSSADGRYLYSVGGTAPYLRVFDTTQDAYVGSVQISGTWDPTSAWQAVRWGSDGIAFAAGGTLYFVRASVVH
jgi:hypothetical protein